MVFFSLLIGDGGRELRLVIRHCAVDLSARTEGAVKSAESVGIKTYFYNPKTKNLSGLQNFLEENGIYQKGESLATEETKDYTK